jgi:hypothetical protein
MKTITSTNLKKNFGKELNFRNSENILVQKRGKDTHMIFTADTGKRLILANYSTGVLSRSDTMNFLGIDWYGCLLDLLREYDIPMPMVSDEIRNQMLDKAVEILGNRIKSDQDTSEDS